MHSGTIDSTCDGHPGLKLNELHGLRRHAERGHLACIRAPLQAITGLSTNEEQVPRSVLVKPLLSMPRAY